MAKAASNKSQDEKRVAENVKSRISGLFSDKEDFPTPSIRQVDDLKSRISELESQLAERQAPAQSRPAILEGSVVTPRPVERLAPMKPRPAEPAPEHEKRMRVRLVGVFVVVALVFLVFAL